MNSRTIYIKLDGKLFSNQFENKFQNESDRFGINFNLKLFPKKYTKIKNDKV